jgi:hypothetical protein
MKSTFLYALIWLTCLTMSSTRADLVNGVISDFQDGTLQGWGGGTVIVVPNSGPSGAGDFSLQLSNGGSANRFAMHNTGVFGVIASNVSHIAADIFRPSGEVTGEIRLVLFNNDGARWTSTTAATIVGDGQWHRYVFSLQESDLTRVLGSSSYSSLTNNLERIMFRHDPGAPSSGGASLAGTMNFDNITAIPEPTTCGLLLTGLAATMLRRRKLSLSY